VAACSSSEDWARESPLAASRDVRTPSVPELSTLKIGAGQGRRMCDVRSRIWRDACRSTSVEPAVTRSHPLQLPFNKDHVRRFDPEPGMIIACVA
jgi:hypothetical protein